MIVEFERVIRGFDNDSVWLIYKDLSAKHPTDKVKCAELLVDAMKRKHFEENKQGKLSVKIVEVTETYAEFDVDYQPLSYS